MTKAQLQTDIREMDKQLANETLPSGVRKALQSARDKARSLVEKGKSDEGAAVKKPSLKPTKKDSLDDCEEILERYKIKVNKDKKRAKKRERQGKPKELTVSETVNKAARTVGKKVRKKEDAGESVTKKEAEATIQQVLSLVKKLVQGMDSEADQRGFIKSLIEALTDAYRHLQLKAETGIHLQGSDKGGQMRIYHYHTQHFNVSLGARQYFEYILAQDPSGEKSKSLIIAMAQDVDDMLGKARTAQLVDEITKEAFIYAAGKLMRAMYWSYGIVQAIEGNRADPHKWYPGFLAQDLYIIANKTQKTDKSLEIAEKGMRFTTAKEQAKANADFKATEKAVKEAGGDMLPESVNWVTFDLNGRRYEIVQKDNGYELHLLSYFDDFFERKMGNSEDPMVLVQMAAERKEEGGKVEYKHPGIIYAGMDDPQVNGLSDFDLEAVNSTLSLDHEGSDQEIIDFFVEELDMNRGKAEYLVNKYRPRFLKEPLFQLDKETFDIKEAGGRMKSSRLSPAAQKAYDRYMALYNEGKSLQEKQNIRNHILVNKSPKTKAGLAEFSGYRQFMDDTRKVTRAEGGKVRFSDKVKHVEKKLLGKPVPKKYQNKETGKRYTKKSATIAAEKIIGAQVSNEKKGRTPKMLLGGIALHTPPAISLMGDQDNLSIHGAG
jgi:hypothetical protein